MYWVVEIRGKFFRETRYFDVPIRQHSRSLPFSRHFRMEMMHLGPQASTMMCQDRPMPRKASDILWEIWVHFAGGDGSSAFHDHAR